MPNKQGNKQTALDIEDQKQIAIAAAEAVYHYRLIARSIGKDEDTLIKWRKADPDFSEQLEQARFRFLNKQVKRAKPEFLLERLEPETFKERKEIEIPQLTQLVINRPPKQPKEDNDNKEKPNDANTQAA